MPLPNSISLGSPATLARATGGALSNDTSLSAYTIEAQTATDEGTITLANSYSQGGVSVGDLTIVATPTHAGASVGTMNLTPSTLVVGDNLLEFDVTAEDGVTVQHYNTTIHVLSAGLPEIFEVGGGDTEAVNYTNGGTLYSAIFVAGQIVDAQTPAGYTITSGGVGEASVTFTADDVGPRTDYYKDSAGGGYVTVTQQGADPA